MVMTLTQLQKRWLRKTGEEMPADIAALPLERVKRAVELVEDGQQVFVPRMKSLRVEDTSSMKDWDKDSEF